jgi:hypothetical protein
MDAQSIRGDVEMKPKRVDNVETYWTAPPPAPSARCAYWVAAINGGWTPNRRVSAMGYHEKADFFGVYIWEYINVLSPLFLRGAETSRTDVERSAKGRPIRKSGRP